MAAPINTFSAKKFFEICVHQFTIEYLRDHYQENAVSLRRVFQTEEFVSSLSRFAHEHGRAVDDLFRARLTRRLLALAVERQQADAEAADAEAQIEAQIEADAPVLLVVEPQETEEERLERERDEERTEFMDYCFAELQEHAQHHRDQDDTTLEVLIQRNIDDNLVRLAVDFGYERELIDQYFRGELLEDLMIEADYMREQDSEEDEDD
jgi:hypothetical protein